MKKCILSAVAGALVMLLAITVTAQVYGKQQQTHAPYEHVDYVSGIPEECCRICGNDSDFTNCWGQDNVGILDLNTFKLLPLPINRYDDHGNLIQKPAGTVSGSSRSTDAKSYVHAYCFPDNGYAHVQMTGVTYAIDRDSVQSSLCQGCLDSINSLHFSDQPPAEYAIVSFADRTVQPLLNTYPWFSAGNFGIDCEFKDNGKIDLLIHYCAAQY